MGTHWQKVKVCVSVCKRLSLKSVSGIVRNVTNSYSKNFYIFRTIYSVKRTTIRFEKMSVRAHTHTHILSSIFCRLQKYDTQVDHSVAFNHTSNWGGLMCVRKLCKVVHSPRAPSSVFCFVFIVFVCLVETFRKIRTHTQTHTNSQYMHCPSILLVYTTNWCWFLFYLCIYKIR